MSKLFSSPISVLCKKGQKKPVKVKQAQDWAEIAEILECWHDTGCWWQGESEKIFYRICLQDAAIKEIFQDCDTGAWFLYKIYD